LSEDEGRVRVRVWIWVRLRHGPKKIGSKRGGLGFGMRMRGYFSTEGVFFRFPLGVLHRNGVLHLQGLGLELGLGLGLGLG
jgi:hypothetical protein